MSWEGLGDLPQHALDGVQLDDLDLLLGGGYGAAFRFGASPAAAPVDFLPLLDVPPDVAAEAERARVLLLTDPEGTPLARLTIETVADIAAAGSRLVGPIEPLQPPAHGPARRWRRTAIDSSAELMGRHALLLGFRGAPTAEQLHTARAHAVTGNIVVLCALVGTGAPVGGDAHHLVRAIQAAATDVPGAAVLAVPFPRHPDLDVDKDEQVAHAVLARYGAERVELLAPDDADGTVGRGGVVVLLTGLSGSGKSTIARALVDELLDRTEREVTLLDGDEVRRMLSAGLGFSRADRDLNVRRIGWVAALAAKHGGIAVCAPIAPYADSRRAVRAMAEAHGRFVLVHVSTPLEVAEARDRKGLYAKARAGLIPEFTGISDPYEEPDDADVVIDASVVPVDDAVDRIIAALGESD